jgi:hypothetical protein
MDGAAVALPDDPAERAEDEDVVAVGRDALGEVLMLPLPDAEFPAAVLEVDPVVVVPVVEVGADGVAVAAPGLAPVVAVGAFVLLPSVTTPPFVTLLGTAVVCAKACATTATENSAA